MLLAIPLPQFCECQGTIQLIRDTFYTPLSPPLSPPPTHVTFCVISIPPSPLCDMTQVLLLTFAIEIANKNCHITPRRYGGLNPGLLPIMTLNSIDAGMKIRDW